MAAEKTVHNFLDENKVHPAWQTLILDSSELTDSLKMCLTYLVGVNIEELDEVERLYTQQFAALYFPERSNILRALRYRPPEDVRAVMIAHEPIGNIWATGLAFSLPRGELQSRYLGMGKDYWGPGKSVLILHDVLREVNILEKDTIYDCDAEEWAERGVLLWNAVLTFHPGTGTNRCRLLWTRFGKHLMRSLLDINAELPVLCFGDWGREIGESLRREGHAITLCDHPTYPKEKDGNDFKEKARDFFRVIKSKQPDLFRLIPVEPTD